MKRYSGNMLLAVALPLLTLAACQTAAAIPAAAPPDVVAQVMTTRLSDRWYYTQAVVHQHKACRVLATLYPIHEYKPSTGQASAALSAMPLPMQALATLPVGSSAAWSGQLSRSLRGVGFHRCVHDTGECNDIVWLRCYHLVTLI